MIEVLLNGVSVACEENTCLQDFLQRQGLLMQKIAVEVEEEVVPRSFYSNFVLKNGMKIEVIAFVGGG